jgi:hypothetical protein
MAFPWATFWTAVGAITPTVALGGAVVFGIRYRHKANVSVWADAYRTIHGVFLEARPSVGAVGPFRLNIKRENDGAQITVIPVVAIPGGTADADCPPQTRRAFTNQFVSQGETVSSSAVFSVPEDIENLIGWFVTFDLTGRGILRDGLNWQGRVFVPLPGDSVAAHDTGRGPRQQSGRS